MRNKFGVIILTVIFVLSLCPLAFADTTIILNDINVDYSLGVISVSGTLGIGNSGVRVSVEILNSSGETVFIDQATSTARGAFKKDIKITDIYKTGTYTVKVLSTGASVIAMKTFDFDSTRDVFYVSNVFIQGAVETNVVNDSNVTVKKYDAYENDTLTAVFNFFSSFSYKMGEAVYQWQASGSEDGIYYDIPGAIAKTYAFTLNDAKRLYSEHPVDFANKEIYIKCIVKAKTVMSSNYCASAVSTNAVEITTVPYAGNVTISGTAKVGKVLTGNYTYGDFQGKSEQNSEYRWLVSSAVNGNYTEAGTGISYIPVKNDVGKYIKFEVTPKSSTKNAIGKSVVSESYVKVGETGGNSGGGGGGSGGGGTVSVIAPPIAAPEPYEPAISYKKFTDVPDDYWAKNDIDEIVKRGDVQGVSNDTFSPEDKVTRAQFSKMILSALKKETTKYRGNFDDVSDTAWYADTVATCFDLGLISGYDGKFMPEDAISREEMTKIIISAYKMAKPDIDTAKDQKDFTDRTEISDWAVDYINQCAGLGLIKGMPDGSFNPKGNATRAEAVVIINRLYKILY